jgi:hypothetical protein
MIKWQKYYWVLFFFKLSAKKIFRDTARNERLQMASNRFCEDREFLPDTLRYHKTLSHLEVPQVHNLIYLT